MNLKLRQGDSEDGPDIARILSNWIDETSWMPRIHTRAEDQGFGDFLITNTDVTLARINGETVGFLSRQADEIQALYLKPTARGQGTGRALLNAAKLTNTTLGLWAFQANTGARRFYLREGFVETNRTDGSGNDEKLPDVRMIWHKSEEPT